MPVLGRVNRKENLRSKVALKKGKAIVNKAVINKDITNSKNLLSNDKSPSDTSEIVINDVKNSYIILEDFKLQDNLINEKNTDKNKLKISDESKYKVSSRRKTKISNETQIEENECEEMEVDEEIKLDNDKISMISSLSEIDDKIQATPKRRGRQAVKKSELENDIDMEEDSGKNNTNLSRRKGKQISRKKEQELNNDEQIEELSTPTKIPHAAEENPTPLKLGRRNALQKSETNRNTTTKSRQQQPTVGDIKDSNLTEEIYPQKAAEKITEEPTKTTGRLPKTRKPFVVEKDCNNTAVAETTQPKIPGLAMLQTIKSRKSELLATKNDPKVQEPEQVPVADKVPGLCMTDTIKRRKSEFVTDISEKQKDLVKPKSTKNEKEQKPEAISANSHPKKEPVNTKSSPKKEQKPEPVNTKSSPKKEQKPETISLKTSSKKEQKPEVISAKTSPKKEQQPEVISAKTSPKKEQQPESIILKNTPKNEQKSEILSSESIPKKEQKPEAISRRNRPTKEHKPEPLNAKNTPKRAQKPEIVSVDNTPKEENRSEPISLRNKPSKEQKPELVSVDSTRKEEQKPEPTSSRNKPSKEQKPEPLVVAPEKVPGLRMTADIKRRKSELLATENSSTPAKRASPPSTDNTEKGKPVSTPSVSEKIPGLSTTEELRGTYRRASIHQNKEKPPQQSNDVVPGLSAISELRRQKITSTAAVADSVPARPATPQPAPQLPQSFRQLQQRPVGILSKPSPYKRPVSCLQDEDDASSGKNTAKMSRLAATDNGDRSYCRPAAQAEKRQSVTFSREVEVKEIHGNSFNSIGTDDETGLTDQYNGSRSANNTAVAADNNSLEAFKRQLNAEIERTRNKIIDKRVAASSSHRVHNLGQSSAMAYKSLSLPKKSSGLSQLMSARVVEHHNNPSSPPQHSIYSTGGARSKLAAAAQRDAVTSSTGANDQWKSFQQQPPLSGHKQRAATLPSQRVQQQQPLEDTSMSSQCSDNSDSGTGKSKCVVM